jgi:hypothetical protein
MWQWLAGLSTAVVCGCALSACVEHESDLPPVKRSPIVTLACHPPEPIGGPVGWECPPRNGSYDVVASIDASGSVVRAFTQGAEVRAQDCTTKMMHRHFHPATTCMGEPIPGEYRERVPEIVAQGDEHTECNSPNLPPLPLKPWPATP